MEYKDTICATLRNVENQLIQAANNDAPLNALDCVTKIRKAISKANDMEKALKRRKEIMQGHNLENLYQTLKDKRDSIEGVNTIANMDTQQIQDKQERAKYTVIIKEDEKVVYEATSFSGVLSTVEKIDDIDMDQFIVQGRTQRMVWGHDLIAIFAEDQLKTTIQPIAMKVVAAYKEIQKWSKEKKEDWKKGVMYNNQL